MYEFNAPKLQLCRFKLTLTEPGSEYHKYYGHHHGKVYVMIGEFSHASFHCLLMEFGTWKFTGMHEVYNLEPLDKHPDDVVIYLQD